MAEGYLGQFGLVAGRDFLGRPPALVLRTPTEHLHVLFHGAILSDTAEVG